MPDKRYEALSAEYENEQSALENEMEQLQASVDSYEGGSERAKRFKELVNRYMDFSELTVPMLNEFVQKIVVHERDKKGSIDATQEVDIHFNFIGEFIPPAVEADPVLTAEQEEEQRKILERRERLHQNYLKRKANGKQKEYEQRYAAKRQARYAENKAALFAEGATLGANALAPVLCL